MPSGTANKCRRPISRRTWRIEPLQRHDTGARRSGDAIFDTFHARPQLVVQHPTALGEPERLGNDHHVGVPGVYAAGDATTLMQQAIVAASAGMVAASMINRALLLEDFT